MNDLMIDYFMAVASNLSFTKTSKELFVSQPAISKQISQLEKELDAKLFVRNNKKTELTDAGRLYYDLFSKYKSDFMSTKVEADRLLGKSKIQLRLGFLEGWDLSGFIPPIIDRFKDKYPDAEININCCDVNDISNGLLKDELDMVITFKNSIMMYKELKISDLTEIGKILIYSSKHKIASKKGSEIGLNDFENDTFIAPWSIVDKMVVEEITSMTRPYGYIPKLSFVKNHESMITCVRSNMGVAIVDEWVWTKNSDDLKWIAFDARDMVAAARLTSNDAEHVLYMEQILKDVMRDQ